jgi:hypothetical protein
MEGKTMAKITCGAVIRRLGATDDPGTAGCLVQFADESENIFCLTAGHVLVGRTAKQRDKVEAKELPGDVIGLLMGWTGLGGQTTVDAALVRVDLETVSPEIGSLGVPTGVNLNPKVGDRLRIFAMGKERSGTIKNIETDRVITMVGPDFEQLVTYRKQILCRNFTVKGCSGAIAVDDDGRVVGMVVAGDENSFTLITPIGAILKHADWGEGEPLVIVGIPVAMPPSPVVRPSPDPGSTPPPRSDSALEAAFRTAIRLNEIGDASPYQLSFAAKGSSGASFGFMQGDMAVGSPIVQKTFRDALAAEGVPATQIDSLVQALSVHLIQNPLSQEDTALVNGAMNSPAGRVLIDKMDSYILAEVRRQLDKCLVAAEESGRTIAPKAQIYMLLWINMTGPPTVLLAWLSGQDVTMTRVVSKPGQIIDAAAMEDYLRATDFFSENPGNLPHLLQSAAAGVALLGPAASAGAGAPVRNVRLSGAEGVDLNASPAIQQLVAIVSESSRALPEGYQVVVTSTFRPGATVAGTGGTSQHALGNAIDVSIVGTDGKAIPNEGEDYTGLYRQLAIGAFHANQRLFPNRSGQLAWGGNFTTGPADGPRDLMHFDYGGDRGKFGSLAKEASAIA